MNFGNEKVEEVQMSENLFSHMNQMKISSVSSHVSENGESNNCIAEEIQKVELVAPSVR